MGTTDLCNEMAIQMERDFTITEVPKFVEFYMPFKPTDDDVNSVIESEPFHHLRSQSCATLSTVTVKMPQDGKADRFFRTERSIAPTISLVVWLAFGTLPLQTLALRRHIAS